MRIVQKRLRSDKGSYCSILKIPKGIFKGISKQVPVNGGVAQLGEHLPCTQGVRSSILLISTKGRGKRRTAKDHNGRIAQVVRAHA